jgi:predicted metal-dependent phosphoesterase TrpH
MPDRRSPLSRRTVLTGFAGGLAVTAVGAGAVRSAMAGPPVSMAMHIHGPFSEGAASFEAHLNQAHKHNVDVVWFTDHDFRVAAHDHRRVVHFDGQTEKEGEVDWTWARKDDGALTDPVVAFVSSPTSADDPGKALRIAATGGTPKGGSVTYTGSAWNYTYSTCIADTVLELDVLPEQAGPGAVLVFQLDLSFHPKRGKRPQGVYSLRYEIGGVTARKLSHKGLTGVVSLPAATGAWTRLKLDLTSDVQQLWPDLVASDNALRRLRVGVEAGAGKTVSAVFDRLVFHRSRREGQAAEALRAEVLAKYDKEFPKVARYRSYEISLTRHLNWYGGDQTLPSMPATANRNDDPDVMKSMVDFLHSHGGIVCWNHPLDVETKESFAKLVIERDRLGADLVEIGRAEEADLLWSYDVIARNGIYFTAVGASDDHFGKDWLDIPERHVTYAWSRSTGVADLVDALRAGAAWYTDPLHYRGSLDIRRSGHTVMGGVGVINAKTLGLELVATDLPAGATLEVVTGVVDYAGAADLTPKITVQTVPASLVDNKGKYKIQLDTPAGIYVRTQVRTAEGRLVGVSNPLWILRKEPAKPIPADRVVTLGAKPREVRKTQPWKPGRSVFRRA